MTGPFVPVGILNPIRAVVGIPIIDSTFSSNALGPFRPPTSTNGLRASRSICERGQGSRHDFGRPALKPATHGEPSGIIVGGPNLPRRRVSGQTDYDCSMRSRQWYRLWYCRGIKSFIGGAPGRPAPLHRRRHRYAQRPSSLWDFTSHPSRSALSTGYEDQTMWAVVVTLPVGQNLHSCQRSAAENDRMHDATW